MFSNAALKGSNAALKGMCLMSDPVEPALPSAAPLVGRTDGRLGMLLQAIEKPRFTPGNGAPFAFLG